MANQIENAEEIDVIHLLKKIWESRILIMAITFSLTALGIFIAVISPNIYTASSTFISKEQANNGISGSLSGIASIAGINLGASNASSSIPPKLYPLIVKSNPFINKLLITNLKFKGQEITLRNYLIQKPEKNAASLLKEHVLGIPSFIKTLLFPINEIVTSYENQTDLKKFSLAEEKLFAKTKDLINISVDKKDGFIKLIVEEKDPEISAMIAFNAQNILQEEVINFKINNSKEILSFTEKLFAQKKNAFEAIQDELATFKDQHQNISSGLFQNNLNRIESKLSIAKALYSELAKQVEQARIQVTKDTPIFTIIEPVIIPNMRTSPKRTLIVLGFAFFGFFMGVIYALGKESVYDLKKRILE